MAVLRLDRRDGTPLAVIVNATAHSVLRSRSNLRFSAGYPGALRRADEAVSQTDERLASEVLRVANGLQTRPATSGRLEVRQESMLLRSRWSPLDFAGEYRLLAPYVGHVASLLQAPVTAILVDNAVALVTFPGEMFVEHQLDLRKRSPVRALILLNSALGRRDPAPPR